MPTADELLSVDEIRALARDMTRVAPDRDWTNVALAAESFADLGLRERVTTVRDALLGSLPEQFGEARPMFRDALLDPAFAGWRIWPVSEAVALLALRSGRARDFHGGLSLLAALTSRLTCEFALRAFLNTDLDRTLGTALRWTRSRDEHVRRLASEGTRPLLPWATQVPGLRQDPALTLPILDALRHDRSERVRRSVANHLNDISRIDSGLAVGAAERWLGDPDDHTPRLVRHALRTLVKQADPAALALMGFGTTDQLTVTGPTLAVQQVVVGDSLTFDASVSNETGAEVKVAVDYVIHFRKANGTLAPKVFKLATRALEAGERVAFVKSHSFRPITTRRYHPGAHALEIQVNGQRHGRTAFELIDTRQPPERNSST